MKVLEMEDGKTIRDAALLLYPETEGNLPAPAIAIVGDTPALRDKGEWDIELAETQIQFREIAMGGGGGGSNPLQTILQIVVVVVAALATWYVGGTGAIGAVSALGYGSFAGAMAGAAVMALGTLLMGVLFKQGLPGGQAGALDAAQASPTYNINASGNQARLYQPEPEGFGRMKIVPDFVANTWMQYVGNDQYGYFVYGIGRGHYDIESLQFGETVFWRDGQFVANSGYYDEEGQQYFENPNFELAPGGDWSPAITAVAVRTKSKTITVTLEFPDGLISYHYEDTGIGQPDMGGPEWIPGPRTAVVHLQVRAIDDNGTPIGDWIDQGISRWTEETRKGFSRAVVLNLTWGRWQVRARNEGLALSSEYDRGRMILSRVESRGPSVVLEIVEPGQPVTVFPDNVETSREVSGFELFAPNDASYTGALGPYVTNSAGTETNKLLFDFVFQKGIGKYDRNSNDTNLRNVTVTWVVEYRKINDLGVAVSGWATLENCSFTGATLTPQRLTKIYNVAKGRYEVRCRRTSNTEGDASAIDSLVWTALRAMLPGTLRYPITCVAFSIKASNTLS